jgi:hypothetical protein
MNVYPIKAMIDRTVELEFDPARLASESFDLAAGTCIRDGKCPAFLWLGGHNHISEVMSIDTRDERLGEAILGFVRATAK